VPIDCLNAFIYALKNNVPATIFFDAEGWDYYLVSTWCDSYIILNKDKTTVVVIEKDYIQLAKELVQDILKYYDEWVKWDYCDTEKEIDDRKNLINDKLSRLEKLI
jgi:hypothetical protein